MKCKYCGKTIWRWQTGVLNLHVQKRLRNPFLPKGEEIEYYHEKCIKGKKWKDIYKKVERREEL